MKSHRLVEIEIPDALAGYLESDDEKIKHWVLKLLLIDLARRGIISFGKAAELAGVDRMSLIIEMGHMGIPYFDGDFSEVLNDAETVGLSMKGTPQ